MCDQTWRQGAARPEVARHRDYPLAHRHRGVSRQERAPLCSDFFVDESKTKMGYEIPFTREFYKYVAPRKSGDIFGHLKELEAKESELMNKILG